MRCLKGLRELLQQWWGDTTLKPIVGDKRGRCQASLSLRVSTVGYRITLRGTGKIVPSVSWKPRPENSAIGSSEYFRRLRILSIHLDSQKRKLAHEAVTRSSLHLGGSSPSVYQCLIRWPAKLDIAMVSSRSKLREMEDRLESLEETVNVLADRKLLLSIRKSLAEIKQGRYKDYRSVKEFREAFETHS